jgi:hypothetical protein
MIARAWLLIVMIALMLLSDLRGWRRAEWRAKLVYFIMFIPILYLSLIFITENPWPNLDELLRSLFSGGAERIVGYFKGNRQE